MVLDCVAVVVLSRSLLTNVADPAAIVVGTVRLKLPLFKTLVVIIFFLYLSWICF